MRNWQLRSLAVVAGIVCFVGVARAAEITMGQTVVLEGKIEPGDYDKIRDSLVIARDYDPVPECPATYLDGCPDEIYLASPGGDVAEAMKIGRLVRTLGWSAIVPPDTSVAGSCRKWGPDAALCERQIGDPKFLALAGDVLKKEIDTYHLENPKANFMCASACFFILAGAIIKDMNIFSSAWPPMIGIHRPYLPPEHLRELNSTQALAAANLTRTTVEKYLREMDVPIKYIDQMFSVPKDQILWISEDSFNADFKGYVPSLRDWAKAKCELTDVEKAAQEGVESKPPAKRTQAEWDLSKRISNKKWDCEQQLKFELRKDAWQRWRKEALQNIADTCAARKSSLPSELENAVSVAKPNQQSAVVALNLAQTAALCRDYGARENAIRILANRGDAKAERILGNLYLFGSYTIDRDPTVAMTWIGRAGAQGDLLAQKFYRDLSGAFTAPNHSWTGQENIESGRWSFRNCPNLC
jgi:hypothetical protein